MHIDLSSAVLIDPIVLLTIVGAMYPFWRAVGRHIRRLDNMLRDWNGEPARDGVPARAGVMARLEVIEHEVRLNNGSSLKDSVKRTEETVSGLRDELRDHIANQGT